MEYEPALGDTCYDFVADSILAAAAAIIAFSVSIYAEFSVNIFWGADEGL